MILHIFDQDFTRCGIVDNYISVAWEEDYNDRGSFLLVCVDSSENIRLLQQGWYAYRKEKQTAMLFRYVKYESKDHQIIVRGYTTNELLNQRIIYRTQSVAALEAGMYDLVKVNATQGSDRAIPRLTTAAPQGISGRFETQFTGTNLLEAENTLGTEGQLGFYMKFDYRNKRHEFTVYEGLNRAFGNGVNNPAIFSAEFKNLENVIIVDDLSIFRNVAYVAGAGEGDERTWVVVGTSVGLDRFELYVDARDLQKSYYNEQGIEVTLSDADYKQLLINRGIQKLNEHIHAKTFVAEVTSEGFGEKFSLGDIVSCKSDRYGVRIDTRIMHYAEVREQNKTTLKLTLGNPEISTLEVVKTWL